MSRTRLLWLIGLAMLAGCGGDTTGTDDDLTSKSAVERELTIKSYVYVEAKAPDSTIQSAVQQQIRTAFGPLRIGLVSVDDREFRSNIDPTTFVKSTVEVVKKVSTTTTVVKKLDKITYTYKARALVANTLSSRTSFSLALLMGSYQSFASEILDSCTANPAEDRDFVSSFWYVWSPDETKCKQLIDKEGVDIEKERQGLGNGQIGEKEAARRYLPVKAELKATTAPKTTYPEYDQLYGINESSKTRVVVYQIVGVAAHSTDPIEKQFENDMGFVEYYKIFKVLVDSFKGLRVAADSPTNPLTFDYNRQTYNATFQQLYNWVVSESSFPSEIAGADQAKFRRAIHDSVKLKWVKLEVPLDVTSARGTKKMTLEIRLIFGTEGDWSTRQIFREAYKNADVVLYDGHSYIGAGAQDPGNYTMADFNNNYQILFFNSCVSFNYYGVPYFKLKNGGTKKLDLVTNGLEVHILDGGKSMGQFIAALFDGKQNTWLRMLEKTQVSSYWGVHDPNRAVDGELDNTYDPTATPITVKEAGSPVTLMVKNTTAGCGQQVQGIVQLTAEAAGATRVDFLVGGNKVASASQSPYQAAWDSKTVADGTVKVTVKASDAAGASVEASCALQVSNGGGGGDLFVDDMESSTTTSNWTATGLWHLAKNGTCANPAYASATSAWYFGQDASCNYKTSGAAKGTLTSKTIAGVTATSKLSFKFYREVESGGSGSFDKTAVEAATDGSTSWKKLWSKDSTESSTKAWTSAEISLADYAGKSIRVRFNFDSVDNYDNEHVGWMIDDVRVTK
jgi:hypothetical protein